MLRLAPSVSSARVGNIKMSKMMNSKQLEMHPDKTGYILVGTDKQRGKMEGEIAAEPICFDNFVTSRKLNEKWLGDRIGRSLSGSVEDTITERSGKITASCYEMKAIVEDIRMASIAGMQVAFLLWESAAVSSLLTNCESWVNMSPATTTKLEDLQYMFLRMVLTAPWGTAKPALTFETGLLPLKFHVMIRKLTFVNVIKHQSKDSLAKQVLTEQISNKWPGLAEEASEICQHLNILDITKVDVSLSGWKQLVKRAARNKAEEEMKEELRKYSKVKELAEERFERKSYFDNKVIEEVRTEFKMRAKVLKCKMNFPSDKKFSADLWRCEDCGMVDTMAHVLYCRAHRDLREGRDINNSRDVVSYYMEVMKRRDNRSDCARQKTISPGSCHEI